MAISKHNCLCNVKRVTIRADPGSSAREVPGCKISSGDETIPATFWEYFWMEIGSAIIDPNRYFIITREFFSLFSR